MSEPKRELLEKADPDLCKRVVRSLRMIFDPELPVNVFDLGLIYSLEIDENKTVYVQMTLTAPNCPEAEMIPQNIYHAVLNTEGVGDVDIDLVFDPPWGRERMSVAAQLALGLI